MKITVLRNPSHDGATVGDLFIDGSFFCHTLEDQVREIQGQPVEQWKVPGQTAIPAGTYQVLNSYSGRFGCEMPLITDVPGFTGIRIHCGNTSADTEGCLLVGFIEADYTIARSRDAFAALYPRIKSALAAGENVTIEID